MHCGRGATTAALLDRNRRRQQREQPPQTLLGEVAGSGADDPQAKAARTRPNRFVFGRAKMDA